MRIFNFIVFSYLSFIYPLSKTHETNLAENPIIKCLAQEEQQLHLKKDQGIAYKLNQQFINLFAGAGSLRIKKNYADAICKDQSMGLSLLKHLVLYDYQLPRA